jgi:Ran GTPase-activating protein 1
LSFENQSLKLDGAVEASPVAECIKNHKVMKTLTLAGNTIGIDAAEVIGQSLVSHPEFERAHWKDMFTGRSKAEIPPALKHLVRPHLPLSVR